MWRTMALSMAVRNLIASSQGATSLASATPSTYNVIHPATGTIAHAVEQSTAEDLKRAVDAAAAGLATWKATHLDERKAVLSRAADLLADASSGWAAKLVEANMKETSVTQWWSSTQIHMAGGMLKTLVASADKALAEETIQEPNATFKISREPYGVCLAMAAWNAVHVLTLRSVVTPLLAGNTVVMKTSETAPYSQSLWAELLFAAGLPTDALSVVHIANSDAPQLTPLLVADKRVRHVNFTGSTRVGSLLASLAGKHLKPTLMELGGKAPVVLLPDADIETAASHIPASKRDALVAALRSSWDTVKDKQARALFQNVSAERVRGLVEESLSAGATTVFPIQSSEKAFVTQTIIEDVTSTMRLYAEESFGPLAAIISVPDTEEPALIDEMVRIANDTDYGLAAAVWGRDVDRAQRVARRIESGAVHVNAPTPADPPFIPHGGWKSSGWGRFNGVEGLRSFTQTRSIEIVADPQPMPLNVFEL